MIILTGATGWIGKTFIKYFLQNYEEKFFNENVRVFVVNLEIS